MIRIVILIHEVSGIFRYVAVYGTNEEHTCSCIISLHHVHSCYEHVHRARSVRKSYNYSGVLLWIMSPLTSRDRTGTTSYVARGRVRCSFIPCWVWRQWTWHMHCIVIYLCHGSVFLRLFSILF